MGTTLTGLTPATTYDALLKTTDNQPLTTTRKVITDGLGNDSALSLATTSASITGTLAVSSTLTASNLSGTNTGDETNATIKSKLGAATTSVDGYLTAANWTTFNAKVGGSGTTNYVPKLTGASTIANSQIFDNGTNVGIGTTSPASKLNVSGDNITVSAGYGIAFSGDQTRIMTPEDNVSGALIRYGSGGIMRFVNGSTEHMRISGTGNVGIGTASPSNKLSVVGSGYFTGAIITDSSLNVGTDATISGSSLLGSYGDNEYLLSLNKFTGSAYLNGNLSIDNQTTALTFNSTGLSFTGPLGMSNAIFGATNITGTGKLQIANIGASGTLNVGSTTTATKRLELTADNSGGAENNTLRFVNTDTTILANEVIGKIEFFSNDASTPGASVKAYISAGSTDATPKAYLDFATDRVTGTPIVRQRITDDGKVLIGSTTDNGSTNLVQVNGGLDYNIVVRNVNSNNFSLILTDKGKFLTQNSATSATITIPTNAAVAFPIGSQIFISQYGAGVLTINGDTGVTVRTRSTSRQPNGRFAEVKLTKIGTDEWFLTGDLAL